MINLLVGHSARLNAIVARKEALLYYQIVGANTWSVGSKSQIRLHELWLQCGGRRCGSTLFYSAIGPFGNVLCRDKSHIFAWAAPARTGILQNVY